MTRDERNTYWCGLVDEQAQSGLTVSGFCRNHHLNLSQFYLQRRRFQKAHDNARPTGLTSPTISCVLWMLQLLQGAFDQNDLIREFSSLLPRQDVIDLYSCILNKPLRIRNRAIAILALLKGFHKKDISKYSCIHMTTLYDYIPDGHPKSPTHGHFKIPHLNSFKM